mgnify:CR=1 FL=1
MLDGASPGSGKYQAQTVSAPQHFQSEDGYPAVSGVFSIRLGRWPVQLFNLCVQFLRLWQSLYAELLQGLFAGNVKLILFLMLSAIEGRILGIFFIFYDFPESAVSGALFFDQLFRLYLLADFINLVPGGGNGTVHICDMLLKILVV